MNDRISDLEQRRRALDPERSFIVQAPAGAGKTGLLTQRFLRLLATVDEPEEILAITFTRKAATEMRNRILSALQDAQNAKAAEDDHDRETLALATAALERSGNRGWALTDHPGRLQVRTIDSLSHGLARRLPLLSRSGGPTLAVDDAGELYQLAARRTLALADDADFSAPVIAVLGHLDNNLGRAETLLATMLARRDQWIRHLAGTHHEKLSRQALETALGRLIDEILTSVESSVPAENSDRLWELAATARNQLPEHKRNSALGLWDGSPPHNDNRLSAWRALAHLLLRKDGGAWVLRKQANADLGFPAPSNARDSEEKQRLKAAKDGYKDLVTNQLPQHDAFITVLGAIPGAPDPSYSTAQWALLEQLPLLLNLAYAQLRLIFAERGLSDHIEVNLAAARALGSDEAPTDLALALEYRMGHLLVDEFQDTSRTQYELLCRLTAGWQPGDGHSFFAVGDPMQSIYRFRQAEVSLFIETRDQGLGDLPLESLVLETNFRSSAQLIEWTNAAFEDIFPDADNCDQGAIRFAPASAFRTAGDQSGVFIHPLFDDEDEAALTVDLIEKADTEGCDTIAVLARSRSHLHDIAGGLSRRGIAFQAVDVQHLGDRLAVRELRSLTRALVLPADRAAWLAVLRAPWCGLNLQDLTALVGDSPGVEVAALLADQDRLSRLSADGLVRAMHVQGIMHRAMEQRRRQSLRRTLEATWLALGGPSCLRSAADLAAARRFLDLVGELESAADLPLLSRIDEALQNLFAPPDPEASDKIQLMTVHKAKGLEFDAVILPGLGRSPRANERELVQWLEWEGGDGTAQFVVAPIAESDAGIDPLEQLLRNTEREKQRLETGRLLYVAATRARRQLHLVGRMKSVPDPQRLRPRRDSLLHPLWPLVGERFRQALIENPESAATDALSGELRQPDFPPLIRAKDVWQPLAIAPLLPEVTEIGDEPAEPEYEWAGSSARHIGTLIHRFLERIANEGIGGWNQDRVTESNRSIRLALSGLTVPGDELEQATAQVIQGLCNSLSDPKGQWILSGHEMAKSEYALTALIESRPTNLVIDRTFVDDEGIRWIIDYKTGAHEGGGKDAFLDREQERYRPQLERYAQVMAQLDPEHPIRLALYFPMLKGWREWTPETAR